jgi:hypothetical protein
MTAHAHRKGHPGLGRLLDYWFGDLGVADTEAVDAHLFGCDACGAMVDGIAALGHGTREAFAAGHVATVASPRFVEQLATRGLRVREYRVPCNGSVNCSAAPEDEVLVGRLQAALQGVQRLDMAADFDFAGQTVWLRDVPFDPARGEVVLLPALAIVRRMPAHLMRVRLLAVEEAGMRELGHYSFHHRPYEGP